MLFSATHARRRWGSFVTAARGNPDKQRNLAKWRLKVRAGARDEHREEGPPSAKAVLGTTSPPACAGAFPARPALSSHACVFNNPAILVSRSEESLVERELRRDSALQMSPQSRRGLPRAVAVPPRRREAPHVRRIPRAARSKVGPGRAAHAAAFTTACRYEQPRRPSAGDRCLPQRALSATERPRERRRPQRPAFHNSIPIKRAQQGIHRDRAR